MLSSPWAQIMEEAGGADVMGLHLMVRTICLALSPYGRRDMHVHPHSSTCRVDHAGRGKNIFFLHRRLPFRIVWRPSSPRSGMHGVVRREESFENLYVLPLVEMTWPTSVPVGVDRIITPPSASSSTMLYGRRDTKHW